MIAEVTHQTSHSTSHTHSFISFTRSNIQRFVFITVSVHSNCQLTDDGLSILSLYTKRYNLSLGHVHYITKHLGHPKHPAQSVTHCFLISYYTENRKTGRRAKTYCKPTGKLDASLIYST